MKNWYDEDEETYKMAIGNQNSMSGVMMKFDMKGVLQDKGKPNPNARPTIIKWFQKRVKDVEYG